MRTVSGLTLKHGLIERNGNTPGTSTGSVNVAAVGANVAVQEAATQRVTVGGEPAVDTTVRVAVRNSARE
ncbi:hypothetical protein [Massilia scottii]|uniref:hypothetical protein n=1 Tax=Massilia scottii TaxID=3057166 RepID=UPI002796D15D|nr:hypothetical protein [Massilia sp. CCM 9029]MDQ1835532.1 hypothetical protein [Massilia sp. CCM 9029]